jgi:hypothetical protein
MTNRRPPLIDIAPDGSFVDPARPPLAAKIGRVALLVAVIAFMAAGAMLALWFALALIPIALGAGLIAWGALRFQMWRAGKSFGGQRNVFRP